MNVLESSLPTFLGVELEKFTVDPDMAKQCAEYVNLRLIEWERAQRDVYSSLPNNSLWVTYKNQGCKVRGKLFGVGVM